MANVVKRRRIPRTALIAWAKGRRVVLELHIFGSYARGEARADSDLDVAVVLNLPADDALAEIIEESEAWARELSAITKLDVREVILRSDAAARDAILIYRRGRKSKVRSRTQTAEQRRVTELKRLAKILDDWAQSMPVVRNLYLFGSRVRGDHRPDSDIDAYVTFDASEDMSGWMHANETEFREINALLFPGELALHQEPDDFVVPKVLAAVATAPPKLIVGKVICVELPKR